MTESAAGPRPVPAVRPRYRYVKKFILSQIAEGRWKPGTALPSQMRMARECGVSLATLRQALGELEDEEVLVCRQGAGTFVRSFAAASAVTNWNRFQRFQGGDGRLLQIRSEPVFVEYVQPGEEVRAALNIPEGEAVVHLQRRLYETGTRERLLSLDDAWLVASFFPGMTLRRLDGIRGSLYRWYEQEFGITIADSRDVVECRIVDRVCARETGLRIGTPLFRLTRLSRTVSRVLVEYRVEQVTGEDTRVVLQ